MVSGIEVLFYAIYFFGVWNSVACSAGMRWSLKTIMSPLSIATNATQFVL